MAKKKARTKNVTRKKVAENMSGRKATSRSAVVQREEKSRVRAGGRRKAAATAAQTLAKALQEKRISPETYEATLEQPFELAKAKIRRSILLGAPPRDEVNMSKEYSQSKETLGEYVTLDWQHIQQIERLITVTIPAYIKDPSLKRPLNIAMYEEPGSGKSHFVECLARRMNEYNVGEVTFNMSGLESIEDFERPLEAVRNLKVVDKLPLLFLDEFDSDDRNYARLLPLLWDGELQVGHRDLKLGKAVIILAASGSHIEKVMKKSKGMQKTIGANHAKLTDLLSRINGGELQIPGLDDTGDGRDRRVDKICLSISLLEARFGSDLELVPWSILRFIAHSKFRYGVRSIVHLVDLIPASDSIKHQLNLKDLHLPLHSVESLKTSSLRYHLVARGGPSSVVKMWRELKTCETPVRFRRTSPSETLLKFLRSTKETFGYTIAAG